MKRMYIRGDVATRLAARSVLQENGCVLFNGSLSAHGYGQFRDGKKIRHAHRVAWELSNGVIPPGLCICHTCDNPRCINISHLFLGTQADNVADMRIKHRGANGASPITELEIVEFLQLRNAGLSCLAISKHTGRSDSAIGKALKRVMYDR